MDMMIQWAPGVSLETVEKQVILAAFRYYRGNKTMTSASLGIAIRTLDNKLEKYQADAKSEKERDDNARLERDRFLARSRGANTPNHFYTGGERANADIDRRDHARSIGEAQAETGKGDVSPAAGVRVEPSQGPAEKQPVPMSERKEVQSVPSAQAAASGSKGRR